MSKTWGFILIAFIIALILTFIGPWNAKQRSADMGASIKQALTAEGINANVDMQGHVAKLSGEMPSKSIVEKALSIAKGTACETCRGDKSKIWHSVSNDMTVKAAPPKPKVPTASPYTFDAVKAGDGSVTVNGFVPNEAARQAVLTDARSKFVNVNDNRVRIALGAPTADWENVVKAKLTELNQLDTGQLNIRDKRVRLTGVTGQGAVKDAVNASIGNVPAEYNASADVKLAVKQINTVSACQTLFNELKGDNKVNFASAKAELVGNKTFDLLNSLVKGAEQCSSFNINVVGHTDSQGKETYNQWLSESRANSVVNYLVTQGVAVNRVSAKGMGETQPIASNQTSVGRAANRRIEFIVTQ